MKIHWPLTLKETDGEIMARVWVPREHAEAEIEKARREARLQGIQEAGSIRLDREQAARAEERERIADMLEREMNAPDSKDHDAEWNRVTRNALRYAITCIRRGVRCTHSNGFLVYDAKSIGRCSICGEKWPFMTATEVNIRMNVNDTYTPQEPKPLDDLPKLGTGLIISTQDSESDKMIAMKVNDIIRHIKTMRSDLNYLMGIKA